MERSPQDLIDTAGADRSAQGVAELAEVMRAEVLQRADLVIWCTSTAIDADERTRRCRASAGSPLAEVPMS